MNRMKMGLSDEKRNDLVVMETVICEGDTKQTENENETHTKGDIRKHSKEQFFLEKIPHKKYQKKYFCLAS